MPHSPSNAKARHYAVIAIILVVLWVLSGVVWRAIVGDEDDNAQAQESYSNITIMESSATPKQRYEQVYGATKPERDVSLTAQTRGEVKAILAREGKPITHGAPIVRIDMQDRGERLAAAKSLLTQRQEEYEGVKLLKEKGYESDVALARASANLKNAKASVKQLTMDIGFTTIRAPFDGLLESVNVEKGDFAGVGVFGVEGSIARVIDIDPLLAVGEITQKDRPFVEIGKSAIVRFANGEEVEGKLTYLAKAATEASRAFPFEVAIPNKNADIAAGISATIRIPLNVIEAHQVPSSILSLNDAGELRVKTLDDANKVVSHKVQILEETRGGVWLGGLPKQVRFISAGAAFLKEGEQVEESRISRAGAVNESDDD